MFNQNIYNYFDIVGIESTFSQTVEQNEVTQVVVVSSEVFGSLVNESKTCHLKPTNITPVDSVIKQSTHQFYMKSFYVSVCLPCIEEKSYVR